LQAGNRQEISQTLRRFKEGSGYDFPAILSIPERLPAMVKKDPEGTLALVIIGLTMAFEAMNLSRPMNDAQIVELAETILDSSEEDYLALEDVLLFLQGLTRGKYGALYESMDIPKFMEKFEIYRTERHQQYFALKEEKHSQNKTLPVNDRIADMFPDSFKDQMRQAQVENLRNEAVRNNGGGEQDSNKGKD
jgi:hypothetical protein